MIQHPWEADDSLSQLAVDHGFADWRRIWEHTANDALSALRNTPANLQVGDIVEIPDRTEGEDTANTENETPFIRLGVPVASVCFVDDGGRPRDEFVTRLHVLEVSNLVTTRQLPTNHLTRSRDRDNFKIEVVDSGEVGNRIPANRTVVEALHPALNPDGTFQQDRNGDTVFIPFNPPRVITGGVDLKRVPGTNKFRSRYFRLVTDMEDFNIRNGRTLLTDHDPNDLRIEILDQIARVTYTSSTAEPLRDEAEVGRDERRFRITVQVLRRTPRGPVVDTLTLGEIERHVAKWVRRTYAAASMSPKLVAFPALPAGTPANSVRVDPNIVGVREVDPPENLVSIFNRNRNTARASERIHFRVRDETGAKDVSVDYTTGTQPNDRTPRQIADLCAAQLTAGGVFSVDVVDNPRTTNLARSCDLLIRDPAGNRVTISEERTRRGGARTRIGVGRLNPRRVALPGNRFVAVGTRDNRLLARNYGSGPDRIDCFVIGRFRGGTLGFAFGRFHRRSPQLATLGPMRSIVMVDGRTAHAAASVNSSAPERYVHALDHEIGHVLLDIVHFNGFNVQLMTNAGASVNRRNRVRDSKRLADRIIPYREGDTEQLNAAGTRVTRRTVRDNLNPTVRVRDQEFATFGENW